MATSAFDTEFWCDPAQWPAPTIGPEGQRLIFLLDAVHQVGMRLNPKLWPQIKQIYRRKELFIDHNKADLHESYRNLHKLLYRYDRDYHPRVQAIYIREESYGIKYLRPIEKHNLAATIFDNIDEIPPENDQLHDHVLRQLVKLFASGNILTYLKLDPFGAELLLPPTAWYGTRAITHPRFVFGETAANAKARNFIDDAGEADERGDAQIYVNEAQMLACLSFVLPLEPPKAEDFSELRDSDIDNWIMRRLLELDLGAKSDCPNKVRALEIIKGELSGKKCFVTAQKINKCWKVLADAKKFKRFCRHPGK